MVYSNDMELREAIVFGLIEGIAQCVPISATGHLALLSQFLVFDEVTLLAFRALLYGCLALLLFAYFFSDIWLLIQVTLRKLSRLPVNDRDLTLLKAVVMGTIPGVLFVVLATTVPYTLSGGQTALFVLASSIFLMYAEWRYFGASEHAQVTGKSGFVVGVTQLLALLPGVPRMSAAVGGGMIVGFSRSEAAKFAYLLSIPVLILLSAQKFIALLTMQVSVNWTPIVVGVVVGLAAALATVHLFLRYLERNTLAPFIWYGLVLAAFLGYISLFT